MDSTPLWVPLVVAVIGVLGTLSAGVTGVLITQRQTERREKVTWDRERELEGSRWAREDQARTFDHRRETYADFYAALMEMARTVHDFGYEISAESELPLDWQLATF